MTITTTVGVVFVQCAAIKRHAQKDYITHSPSRSSTCIECSHHTRSRATNLWYTELHRRLTLGLRTYHVLTFACVIQHDTHYTRSVFDYKVLQVITCCCISKLLPHRSRDFKDARHIYLLVARRNCSFVVFNRLFISGVSMQPTR